MSFWGELKRRNVFKVGVAYAIVAWLLVQIANTFFPILHLPEWTVTLVAVLVILGFPVALIHAWAYEVTPDGIKRTKEVPLADSITHITGRKLNYLLAGLLVVAVVYILFDNYYLDRRFIETEVASRVAELATPSVDEEEALLSTSTIDTEEAQKTIAVLPFVNRSSEKDQEYFVDGLSDEIITILSQIPDLQVTSSTSSFSFKNTGKTIQEVADVLGVEHILEGSVRKSGNALRITAQLIRAADDYHLWSDTYDRNLDDIFAVQEDIAMAVVNELKVKLGVGESLKQLGGTDNVDAYELYLKALGQYKNGIQTWSDALESINGAVGRDPGFALAWALKASIHNSNSMNVPEKSALAEVDDGFIAAKKAIELEPNLAVGYVSLGANRVVRGEFAEAEFSYRKALELSTEQMSIVTPEFYFYYVSLGYFKKAREFAALAQRNDPLNPSTRRVFIQIYGIIGDMKRAEEEYENSRSLPNDLSIEKWFISMVRLGGKESLSIDELPEVPLFNPIWNISREHLESPEGGLSELRKYYTDNEKLTTFGLLNISCWAARFGNPEFALDAMERVNRINSANISYIWLPLFREVRQLPRFKKFIRENGLVDYWNEFGWPDICRKLDNGNFVCD